MADKYNPNSIGFGIPGGAYTFKTNTGGDMTDGGVRIIEPGTQFKPKKEGILIEQPGISGNAGAIAVAGAPTEGEPAEKQMKTSITIQVPRSDSPAVELGYYFDSSWMGETARWVVYAHSPVMQSGTHWTQELDIARDHKANVDVDTAG